MHLKGITWNHSRGIVPLQAAAQRFSELHPGIAIEWHKRTLQEFADYPIEELTRRYDLLIIDHPWVGTAAAINCVLPLEKYLPKDFLALLVKSSVGASHESYNYNGQWALAIDAASPVASYRPDLFEKNTVEVPETWEDLINLARQGRVAVPAIPIDLLMNFYTFCIQSGKYPFSNETEVVDLNAGERALKKMKELYDLLDQSMFERNPIAVAELMSSSDEYWYCPFAYGYSNYSRKGYGKNLLEYCGTVKVGGENLRTTLGGTGIAVSAFSKNVSEALLFVQMVCSAEYQASEYIFNGGQPGYAFGWRDELNNRLTNDFFKNNLNVIERSYVRPRYHGYLHFQDEAGKFIQEYLMQDDAAEASVIEKLNEIYRRSLKHKIAS